MKYDIICRKQGMLQYETTISEGPLPRIGETIHPSFMSSKKVVEIIYRIEEIEEGDRSNCRVSKVEVRVRDLF